MKYVLFLFLSAISIAATAQEVHQKFGYANWEYVFSQMPDSKQVESGMKIHGEQLKSQMDAKYKEYEAKLNAYKALPANTLDAVRRDKEGELTRLQENIQKFQQDAQASLQKKQETLMAPIFDKVAKAIDAVAKENGYSYIFTAKTLGGEDVLLYSDEKFNVSALVLKKLGVTPVATTATK